MVVYELRLQRLIVRDKHTRECEHTMFPCRCGDFEYPISGPTEDESVWCDCGLRIAPQREAAQER